MELDKIDSTVEQSNTVGQDGIVEQGNAVGQDYTPNASHLAIKQKYNKYVSRYYRLQKANKYMLFCCGFVPMCACVVSLVVKAIVWCVTGKSLLYYEYWIVSLDLLTVVVVKCFVTVRTKINKIFAGFMAASIVNMGICILWLGALDRMVAYGDYFYCSLTILVFLSSFIVGHVIIIWSRTTYKKLMSAHKELMSTGTIDP